MEISLEGLSAEQITGLASLAKGLGDNPKTRKDFMRLVKSGNPDLSIPEVDLPDEIMSRIETEAKKREALEAQLLEASVREQVRERRELLKRQKNLSDAQVEDVEKMMVEKGISNHDTAAEFYLSQQRLAEPTPSYATPKKLEVPALDQLRKGASMREVMETAAHQAIDDMKSGRI
jgi:hypothetical protein